MGKPGLIHGCSLRLQQSLLSRKWPAKGSGVLFRRKPQQCFSSSCSRTAKLHCTAPPHRPCACLKLYLGQKQGRFVQLSAKEACEWFRMYFPHYSRAAPLGHGINWSLLWTKVKEPSLRLILQSFLILLAREKGKGC